MRFLLGRVILVVGFSLSSLLIHPAIPFWPTEILLKNQLIALMGIPLYTIQFCFVLLQLCETGREDVFNR